MKKQNSKRRVKLPDLKIDDPYLAYANISLFQKKKWVNTGATQVRAATRNPSPDLTAKLKKATAIIPINHQTKPQSLKKILLSSQVSETKIS